MLAEERKNIEPGNTAQHIGFGGNLMFLLTRSEKKNGDHRKLNVFNKGLERSNMEQNLHFGHSFGESIGGLPAMNSFQLLDNIAITRATTATVHFGPALAFIRIVCAMMTSSKRRVSMHITF